MRTIMICTLLFMIRQSRNEGRSRTVSVATRWLRSSIAVVAALATAAMALVGSAPAASAASQYIYWGNYGSGTIGRANVDGTGANQSFIPGAGQPVAIYVDGSFIYWANYSGHSIGRANIDGTGANPSFIAGISGLPDGVTVNGSHIYWANNNGSVIGRANLDGTGMNESFITGLTNTSGVVKANDNYLYWGDYSNKIGRANLDGTGVDQSFITGTAGEPEGLSLTTNSIYWTNSASGAGASSVGKANLDGTGVNNSFITGTGDYSYGLTLDATNIYWANYGNNNGTTLGRANIDGTGVNSSFITGASSPAGIGVTGENSAANNPPSTTQTVANGCVTAGSSAKSIPRKGRKQLMKPGCKTNAGKTVGVKVSAKLRKSATRGDVLYYRLYCKVSNTKEQGVSKNSAGAYCKKGSMYIQTYGQKLTLKITWSAPASGSYTAYKLVRTYKT